MELKDQGGLQGVVFTAETYLDVRQWVQDRSSNDEIVASPTRLYLPILRNGMVAVDENDTIWFDPEAPGPNAFLLERG